MPPAPPSATELVWADAHNHLHDPRISPKSDPGGVGECPCLINATSEDDWDSVLETAALAPGTRHPALGVHPWFADLAKPGWDDRLHDHLAARADLAIGECGLDGKTRACPLDLQIPVFETQLRLARHFRSPLALHCVAAWGRLSDCLDREPPPARWMVHGFSGSLETARRLLAMGAFLSIPVRALNPQGSKIIELFKQLPQERILLETDAPNPALPPGLVGKTDQPACVLPSHLPSIGTALAHRLNISPEALASITHRNFLKFSSNQDVPD